MNNFLRGLLIFCLASASFAADNQVYSPVGYFKTIDDVTGVSKSIVEIREDSNHQLFAKVTKIFPLGESNDKELCVKCEGELKNKPILGMTVMYGLTQSRKNLNEWANGSILDPKNGKVYHSMLNVIDNGNKVRVRGYFGVPLLGRTQIWLRVQSPRAE